MRLETNKRNVWGPLPGNGNHHSTMTRNETMVNGPSSLMIDLRDTVMLNGKKLPEGRF